MENFKPVDDYEGLRKQFSALNNLYQSLSRENTYYRDKDYSLSEAMLNHLKLVIESEKAMNETLTNENEALRQQLTKPADDTISVSKGEWEAMKKLLDNQVNSLSSTDTESNDGNVKE
jgi:hypothetical protein